MERQTGGGEAGDDAGDAGAGRGTLNNAGALPRQRDDPRRRLLRPDRTPQDAGVVTPEQAQNLRNPSQNPWELLNGRDAPTRQPPQWNFQTPQADRTDDDDEEDEVEEEDEEGDFDIEGGDPVSETGVDPAGDEEGAENEEEAQEGEEPPFDASAIGLKEISNLASFTVSSYKPGCGVKELRDDDVNQFWQSDGPQPHRLNIHFIKRVEIRALRLYLDYELDESYTPTKIQITAGFGPNQTIPFTTMELSMPKGWIDVPVEGAGGGPDGNSLCCWFVRVVVLENHQNGKDTHVRGVKVYALDDAADTADNNPVEDMVEAIDDYEDRMARMNFHDHDEDAVLRHDAEVRHRKANARKHAPGDGGLSVPDFMREPEIR